MTQETSGIADNRQETDLCRTDWQGGRNDQLICPFGRSDRSAGSGSLRCSLRFLGIKCWLYRAAWHRHDTARKIREFVEVACLILGGSVRLYSAHSSTEWSVRCCLLKVNTRFFAICAGECFSTVTLIRLGFLS